MCASVDLQKAIYLFKTHPGDPDLYIRHLAALKQVSQGSSGFAVQDLPLVTELLGCTLDLCQTQHGSLFFGPACDLVRAIGRPYQKLSSTDELKLPDAMTQLLKTVARIFQHELPLQLQVCTAEVLQGFASVWGERPAACEPTTQPVAELDLRSVQRVSKTHQSLLADSHVVPAMCLALQRAQCSSIAHCCGCCQETGGQQQQQEQQQLLGQQGQQHGLQQQHEGCCCTPEQQSRMQSHLASALVSALLETSYSHQLCTQQLEAGVLQQLGQLLQHEAAAGMNSKQGVQLVELLWNLLELAPDAADRAASSDAAGAAAVGQYQPCEELGQAQTEPGECEASSHSTHAGLDEQTHCNDQAPSLVSVAQEHMAQPSKQQCQMQQCVVELQLLQPDHCVAKQLVQSLSMALQQQVATCNSVQRLQQRNDTLTVLYLMSQCSAFLQAMADSTTLMQLLLAAASQPYPEAATNSPEPGASAGSPSHSSRNSKLDADHSMKLLSWSILGKAATASRTGLTAFEEAGLLQLLLDVAAYGINCASSASSRAWFDRLTPEQLSASQQLAWSTMQQVAPLCKTSFQACEGVKQLLNILTAHSLGNIAGGLGSSVQHIGNTSLQASSSTGSCSWRNAESTLRLLRRLLQGDAELAGSVVMEGGAPVLLQLLQTPAVTSLTPVRQGVLLCLSELCSAGGRTCLAAVRSAGGVILLLKECQSILDGDPCVPSLAALNALWSCVLCSSRSRAQLLAADGMDVMLSLLQRGNPALRPVLLSILADLLADTRSHSFFWEWHAPLAAGSSNWSSRSSSFSVPRARVPSGSGAAAAGSLHANTSGKANPGKVECSSTATAGASNNPSSWLLACCNGSHAGSMAGTTSITAIQLLIMVWRHQEEALGLTGPDGVLADPSKPLSASGGSGCRHIACTDSAAAGSAHVDAYGVMLPSRQQALARIAEAGRPHRLLEKVYACFAALGIASSTNSCSVSADGIRALQQLPPADAATLVAIQMYKVFRQGEVWQAIQADFAGADLPLTQEDSMRLDSGIQNAQRVAVQVQAAQASLLNAASSQQLARERIIYDNMAAQAAADAQAKVYEKDSSKLTMRERLAAKIRKEEMLRSNDSAAVHAAIGP